MSEKKETIGEKTKKLVKGLENFTKLVAGTRAAASGDVAPESSSEGAGDPSGVNQDVVPKETSPENIGYESVSSQESVSSSGSDSNMTPTVEDSVITQEETVKAVKTNKTNESLDKIITQLEDESGVSKAKDYDDSDSDSDSDSFSKASTSDSDESDTSDTSESDDSDDDSDDDTIEVSDIDDLDSDTDSSSSSSDSTEKAVYIEVNDLVKGVLKEEGIGKKLSRIEKALSDHEEGMKHLSKGLIQVAKALRSIKNASPDPIRKSIPSVKRAENTLSKAIIANKLEQLAEKGEVPMSELIRFEGSGLLSTDTKVKLGIK